MTEILHKKQYVKLPLLVLQDWCTCFLWSSFYFFIGAINFSKYLRVEATNFDLKHNLGSYCHYCLFYLMELSMNMINVSFRHDMLLTLSIKLKRKQ